MHNRSDRPVSVLHFAPAVARLTGACLRERPLSVARLTRPSVLASALRCAIIRGRMRTQPEQTPVVLWQSDALGRLLQDVTECRW